MQYPIFVLAKDDRSIRMHSSENDLNWYEQIDIEDMLYQGWDSAGIPIDIYYDVKSKRVCIKSGSNTPQLDQLKRVLEQYAKEYFKLDSKVGNTDFVSYYSMLNKK